MRDTVRLKQPEKEQSVIRHDDGIPLGPRNKQTFKFVYYHMPKGWTFDLERGFLPVVKKLEARPGLNGCKRNGSMALPIARVTERGGTVLDPKDQRLGPYMDYVHFYPIAGTNGKGKYYVDFNMEAVVLPNKEVIWNTEEMREKWAVFMEYLRDNGLVPPLIKEVYMSLVERERKKVDRLYGRLDRNPHLKAKLERAQANLEGMQKAWDAGNKKLLAETAKKGTKRTVKKAVDHG